MSAPLNWIQFIGSVELGLIYSLVTIGVYLSFRTLQFPDMTVDGSFPLGAVVAATLITAGVNPYIATLAAILAGAMAGIVTAWLSTHLRMLNLLAGILTMMALYSINLRVGGRPNIALMGEQTIFSGVTLGDRGTGSGRPRVCAGNAANARIRHVQRLCLGRSGRRCGSLACDWSMDSEGEGRQRQGPVHRIVAGCALRSLGAADVRRSCQSGAQDSAHAPRWFARRRCDRHSERNPA